MPRPPRLQFPGAFYHIYNRGVAKQPIGFDERDRRTFMQLLGAAVRKFELRLFAYCLMENHFHLYLQTPLANLNQAMQHLQGQYAHYVNLRYERVGSLFQDRYKSSLVETDAYSLPLVRYIHWNPREAGLVSQLEDYDWSSYPCYVGRLSKWDWLETDWVLRQFDEDSVKALELFRQFHEEKPMQKEIQAKGVRPLFRKGSDPF